MTGPSGDTHQVAPFAQHAEHLDTDVQHKQTAPLHKKAHFVFGVGVLLKELAAQELTIRMIRRHPNRIDRGVTAIALNPGNRIGIGLKDGGLIGPLRQALLSWPLLKADASAAELRLNHRWIMALQLGHLLIWSMGCGFVWKDAETTHRLDPGRIDC